MARKRKKPECPHPEKSVYRQRLDAALSALHRWQVADQILEPYECPCGRWHLRDAAKRQRRAEARGMVTESRSNPVTGQ